MLTIRIIRQRSGRIGNTMYGSSRLVPPSAPFWQRSRWYLWPPGYEHTATHTPPPLGRSTFEMQLAPGFYLEIGQEGD